MCSNNHYNYSTTYIFNSVFQITFNPHNLFLSDCRRGKFDASLFDFNLLYEQTIRGI